MFDFLKKKEKKDLSTVSILPKGLADSSELELRDILAPSALKINSKEINLGEKVARNFFDISFFVHPLETAKILRSFQKKVAEVQSQIRIREEKGLVRDPMLDTAYQDLENLRDELQQAQEKMFEVGLYISVYANNSEELDKVESEIKSILESKMIYVKPALFQQEQGFRSILPTAKDELNVHSKINSSPLSSLFPFVSFDLTSDKGILYGINRHNSSLVLFDRFSLENYNSVTLARSGAGKSYATKLEILRTLMFDAEVLVIDPEKEYEY